LKAGTTSVTVPEMSRSSARRRSARHGVRPRRRSVRRARLQALAFVAGVAVLVVVFLGAFGSSQRAFPIETPASSSRLLPAGPPRPQVLALQGTLRLQLPVPQSRVTAVGYHAAGTAALPLHPIGRQANEGFFARAFHRLFGGGGKGGWYQLGGGEGPSTGAVDVGAPAGTDVYAPIDGIVVGILDDVVDGRKLANVLEVQPLGSTDTVVAVSRIDVDPSLAVGSPVTAGVSKLGRIVDFSRVERQALARHTRDAGNHVTLQVQPAPAGSS